MDGSELRNRAGAGAGAGAVTTAQVEDASSPSLSSSSPSSLPARTKPANDEHGLPMQIVRGALLFVWMNTCCLVIHITQLAGIWLYFVDKDLFYNCMTWTKQAFGLLVTTLTQWFAPITIRISGSQEVRAQVKLDQSGNLDTTAFPDRMVLFANHQIYSDWLFLWWIAYTARLHGHIYIILKESLKWIPIIGPGMQLYRFIFMARNWSKDQERLRYRLDKLNSRHGGPMAGKDGKGFLDPMWLLIFPEGTNLSANTRRKSKAFADKSGIEDFKHVLLPRSTGLRFCLQELKDTVDWVYDCTVAYEGIPPGQYGQDVYTNRGIYFGGRPPRSVNMHWRRFHMSTIPVGSQAGFEAWLMDRWREKDALLDYYQHVGRFPADTDTPTSTPATSTILPTKEDQKVDDRENDIDFVNSKSNNNSNSVYSNHQPATNSNSLYYTETQVRYRGWWEPITIFVPPTAIAAVCWGIVRSFRSLFLAKS